MAHLHLSVHWSPSKMSNNSAQKLGPGISRRQSLASLGPCHATDASGELWCKLQAVHRLQTEMGMHRDGARWNLPEDVVEERRKVFWECNAADVFQAQCFSRP